MSTGRAARGHAVTRSRGHTVTCAQARGRTGARPRGARGHGPSVIARLITRPRFRTNSRPTHSMSHFFAARALAADTIALADAAADATTDATKLLIRSICGNKSTTITVEPADSVRTVKAKILNGCTPDWNLSNCMRMLYGCEILDETLPLAHYSILSGSTVFTLRKCRVRECRHERRNVPSSHTTWESTSQLAKSITTPSVDAALAAATADAEDPVMGIEDVDDLDATKVEAGYAVEVGAEAEGTADVTTTNLESTTVAVAATAATNSTVPGMTAAHARLLVQRTIDRAQSACAYEVTHISAACKRLKHNGVEVAAFKLLGWTLRYHVRSTCTSGDWYAISPEGDKYRSHSALQRRVTERKYAVTVAPYTDNTPCA